MATSPLKQIMDIRRDELPQALSMSVYFFLVITAFWIRRWCMNRLWPATIPHPGAPHRPMAYESGLPRSVI